MFKNLFKREEEEKLYLWEGENWSARHLICMLLPLVKKLREDNVDIYKRLSALEVPRSGPTMLADLIKKAEADVREIKAKKPTKRKYVKSGKCSKKGVK